MKKLIPLLLCLLLLVGLAACTPNDNNETTNGENTAQLLVGYGRTDISPTYSVRLQGYSGTYYSEGILDPIYATCVAMTDSDDNTVLMILLDLINPGYSKFSVIRKNIADKIGVPVDNVILHTSHTHTAPNLGECEENAAYQETLEGLITSAALAAMEDRKPSKMYTAATNLKNMNFVRHYVMSGGSYAGSNFGNPSGKTYVKHVKDVDDEMQLIRFKRDSGKDVVLVNWAAHPIRTTSNNRLISADYVGSMRMNLEAQMGCYMGFFYGAGGNVEPSSRIQSENITSDYAEQGAAMAQEAILACDNMVKHNPGKIQMLRGSYEATVNKSTKMKVPTWAVSIGDVAFAFAPYEMFDTNGKFIKKNSPYEMTFVSSLSNLALGYVAAEWAYAYQNYEVDYSRYAKGTGEALADKYVSMLEELHAKRDCYEVPAVGEQTSAQFYFNLDKGAELTADAGGVYTLRFLQDGKIVALKVSDKALLDALLLQDFVGLILDGDKITGMVYMQDMPQCRLSQDYYVQSVSGNTAKLNASETMMGTEVIVKFSKDTPIYDATAATPGTTTLVKGDRVTVLADQEGTPIVAYVTRRTAAPHEGTLYCQHCKKEVSWMDWLSTVSVPTAEGHYLLSDNINVSSSVIIGSGQICMDLNGKTITQTTAAKRIYNLANTVMLNIMDSAGGGKIVPSSKAPTESGDIRGMIFETTAAGVTINLYSGTLDGSNCSTQYGNILNQEAGTFNMYGGEILGGTSYGNGAAAIRAAGIFNMYGGRIAGGKVETTVWGQNTPAGGTIRCTGIMTLYDGIIEGGYSFRDGGVISVHTDVVTGSTGHLILKGGTITGGEAQKGGGIYAAGNATVTISGNVKITGNENGNLFLGTGATLIIGEEGLGENAQIGITMVQNGTFVQNAPAGADLSKHFTCDQAGKKIVKNGDGSWSIK